MHPSRSLRAARSRIASGAVSAAVMMALALGLLAPVRASAIGRPWKRGPWPSSSRVPVTTLDHPSVEWAAARGELVGDYRFAAFGNQRTMADGEWQEVIRHIAAMDSTRPVAFLVDTGNIVENGSHSDQFRMLQRILDPVAEMPYLVAAGSDELDDNRTTEARANTATFLAYLDPEISPERLYYRKDLGAATFLFLDTNDFTYGERGERDACPVQVAPDSREADQLEWLRAQAVDLGGRERLVFAVMHHPIVQSAEKDRDVACALWNFQVRGEGFADLLAAAGVDVVLTGHTHTYERFRLVRDDGHEIQLVNLSGQPHRGFPWIRAGGHRSRDLRGREREVLEKAGWRGLDHWTITQEDVMPNDEASDQFAVVTVETGGGAVMEVHFLDDDAPGGERVSAPVRLR